MDVDRKTFGIPDYVVFALVLAVSVAIGVFYGCTGGKQRTTAEFLMANRQMNFIPVAMSLLASFMSAITLLGTPAETYRFGIMYWWIWVAYGLLIPFAAHFFLPVFFRLKLTTVYEYLELRFKSRSVRVITAITFSLQMVMYMSIVLYAPSLALNQVTGLNVWVSVVTVGVVCTFYTSIGGMKAVMWTDTFQIIMMFAGLIAILVQGSINRGGFSVIWQDNAESGRTNINGFDPDPFKRHTFWSLSVGGFFTWLAIYGVNQAQMQRALCVPTLRDGQIALWLNFPGLTGLMIVCGLCGMVIYSEYKDCDPLSSGAVTSSDQLLPFYVMEKLSHIPGLAGLFTASLFSGALSTISSGLNSLSAVALQDILRLSCLKNISEAKATMATKIIACFYGVVCIGLTFVAAQLGGILQAALALFGMIGGPQLGLFFLAILFPCANWIGALAGLICGLLMSFWVGIGAQIYKPVTPMMPMSTAGCPVDNSTMWDNMTTVFSATTMGVMNETATTAAPVVKDWLQHWYELSYMHIGTLAVVVVVVVGLIVSFITGPTMPGEIDPKLVNPIGDIFCCCLPKGALEWCRCFVPLYKPEMDEHDEEPNGHVVTSKSNGCEDQQIHYELTDENTPHSPKTNGLKNGLHQPDGGIGNVSYMTDNSTKL